MSKAKALDILENLLRCDKKDVESFGNQYAWGGAPPLEERIGFLEYRFKSFAGDVVAAIRELAEEGSPDSGREQP